MPDILEKRWNWAMWLGFLLALGAVLCNAVFFANFPGKRDVAWLSLLLALVALIFVAKGLWRIFAPPRLHRGRIPSSILCVFSLLLTGMAIFAFFQARTLPLAAGAPQVGQKAPDFTLADTTGQPVLLDELFAPPADSSGAVPTKAVLLIFYRGYW
jgi:hypothetical protein